MVDSDWAGCVTTRRSQTGFIIWLGTRMIRHTSNKQPTVAMSTPEAEWVGLAYIAREMKACKLMLRELYMDHPAPALIRGDNVGSLYWAKSPSAQHIRKHIDIKRCWLTEAQERGFIELQHVRTQINIADMLTKALKPQRFTELRDLIMSSKTHKRTMRIDYRWGQSDLNI